MSGLELHGFCDPRFQPLKEAFVANFEDGVEVGASLAVTHHGRPVVDLWAGHTDFARTRAWEKDTIVLVFSSTKVPLILCMLKLIGDGRVDLDAPVATYWPEFAAGGKDRVTVREAMSYRGGVPGFEPPVPFEALRDWNAMTANLAAQTHWFGGESRLCYHPVTYGFLLGEIIRRVDGRMPSRFFRETFAEPAGIDFQMGLRSEAERARLAEYGFLKPPDEAFTNDLAHRAFYSHDGGALRGRRAALADWMAWEQSRAEIPAANGFANARAMARLCAIAACGGELDGARYLSKPIIDEASCEQVYAEDPFVSWASIGLGFFRSSPMFPVLTPSSFFGGGYGGSLAIMDQQTGVGFGYAMNNLIRPIADDPRGMRFFEALTAVMTDL
jgi:CubicO group peptidase (beta-lactamase class C family)